MKALVELISRGGPVMFAILALSVVLYSRCFRLLISLRRSRRLLTGKGIMEETQLVELRHKREQVRDSFNQQRVALASMIAAAPLMGLLGTVSGMVRTFESLSGRTAEKSMEGLARGISEVLVATESGLVVAIPALLVVHLAHREMRKFMQRENEIVRSVRMGVTS